MQLFHVLQHTKHHDFFLFLFFRAQFEPTGHLLLLIIEMCLMVTSRLYR